MTSETQALNLDAYYFHFQETGVEPIDRVLSEIANAGNGAHHTQDWDDNGYIDRIQGAANDAATKFKTQKRVADTFKQCLTDTYRPHVQEVGVLREVSTYLQEHIEHLEATIARLKAADPDLFNPDEDAEDKVYETYGSNGRYLREDFLAALGGGA